MNPRLYCTECSLTRDVMLHRGADFPPDAARRWFKKNHKNCGGMLSTVLVLF